MKKNARHWFLIYLPVKLTQTCHKSLPEGQILVLKCDNTRTKSNWLFIETYINILI